ncbi:MAG: YidH family protein [Stenotrophobium sp.]
MSDPRVFFAAERTLLAWVRSGLTVMALGFVVARFGLFLGIVSASLHLARDGIAGSHRPSEVIGIALVVLGACAIAVALQNHRAYIRTLPPEDIPRQPMPWLTTSMATLLAIIGMLLAIYLALV